MTSLTIESQNKLENSQIIWIASVRPDNRPHLVPVWFVWFMQNLYICVDPASVKANNLKYNNRVTLALEDGTNPIICEGQAAPVASPWPDGVIAGFLHKYDWEITQESQYKLLIEIIPQKWLTW